MNENTSKTHTYNIVEYIFNIKKNFEGTSVYLSDRVAYSQYEVVDTIRTHQNKGFLNSLPSGETDDRIFKDIVTSAVETNIDNSDIDTENFDVEVGGTNRRAQKIAVSALLQNFLRQTHHGIKINDIEETYHDDGNVVVRYDDNSIYEKVDIKNLYLADTTAKTVNGHFFCPFFGQ